MNRLTIVAVPVIMVLVILEAPLSSQGISSNLSQSLLQRAFRGEL